MTEEPLKTKTTAEILGAYFRELAEEGISGELAESLVRDAAHVVHMNDGVAVRAEVSE